MTYGEQMMEHLKKRSRRDKLKTGGLKQKLRARDEPLQILCDELASQGKTWDEIKKLACSLPGPEEQLDLAEWLARHRGASNQEITEEKHRIIRSCQKRIV